MSRPIDVSEIRCEGQTCTFPGELLQGSPGAPFTTRDLGARVVPSQRDGTLLGYKLYGIRKGSMLDALGFVNGDLVQSIGGVSVADQLALMEIVADLVDSHVSETRRYRVTYQRSEEPKTLTIAVIGRNDGL